MPDYPDGVQVVQVAVTVENELVLPSPATEVAAGAMGRYSGSSNIYQTVASWTVSTAKTGVLKEVGMASSSYTKTLFRLIIGAKTYMTDVTLRTALSLPFSDLNLAAGAEVRLSAKSSDGTAIVVDGSIVGKELG